jgi:hypothetical protein
MTHAKDEALKPAPVQPMAHIVGEIDHTGKVWKPVQPADVQPVQEPVACECNQGQVCHVCDPITPSKQSAQQEPAFWYYTLVVEGQVVGENFTTVNWDTRVEPFGRYDIDHGGKVTKQPLYTTPPAPAVPDAMTSADIQEHIEYVAGWNDCRQAMLEMMK